MFKKKFDPLVIRKEYKIFEKKTFSKTPIYFDNACMTLKPKSIIDAMVKYYEEHPSCHSRAVHSFAKETSKKVDEARSLIAKYINANSNEVVFTKNTTESLNMIANMLELERGDCVVTTDLEHNSNLLPWQFLTVKKGIRFYQLPIAPNDEVFNLEAYEFFLKHNKVKVVSCIYTSNITGMSLPIKDMCKIAHENGAVFILDAAQAMAHEQIDFKDLDVDFAAFSIHKMFGPTGVGILYGKQEHLNKMIPFYVGGEGVTDVHYDSCQLAKSPEKFEVGLQDYAGIIGAGEAIRYISKLNINEAHQHIINLNSRLSNFLNENADIMILGPKSPEKRSGIVNFSVKNREMGELSLMLDQAAKIMVRSGVHCGHAWFHKYDLLPSLRVSFSIYNTEEEVEKLIEVLKGLNIK